MKKILILPLLALSLVGYSQQQGSFVATVDGWDDDTIFTITLNMTTREQRVDTLVACKGRVIFSNPNAKDTIYLLLFSKGSAIERNGGRSIPLMMDAATIETTIFGESKEIVRGTLRDGRLSYQSKGTLPIFKDRADLHTSQLDLLYAKDQNERLIEKDPRQEYFDVRQEINGKLRAIEADFVRKNPAVMLSGLLVSTARLDDFYSLYNVIDDSVKNGCFASVIAMRKQQVDDYNVVKANRKIKVGNTSPEFMLSGINGETVTLSSFAGKWVLLDFWGSWCGWCIKGFPKLKDAYAKHKSKMEVVGIACEDKEDDWRGAVAKHELEWTNLISDKQVQLDYAIEAFPTKILIDPNGVIRLVAIGEEPDFHTKLDEILEQ